MGPGRVVVWGPSPLLAVTIRRGAPGPDAVEVDAAGQAVWALRAAAAMGAATTLVAAAGGPLADVVLRLLGVPDVDLRLVPTGACGCYVTDERGRAPTSLATAWAPPPTADEVDALLGLVAAVVTSADVLVVCNPMPGEALPLETYATLVAAAREAGARVVVDLSSPRLESAVTSAPEVVKVNDWELAESVAGPVALPEQRRLAVARLLERGARSVVVTRGPATVLAAHADGDWLELTPPVQPGHGTSAGCGDTMTGAVAASLASGASWRDAVRLGVAAGAAHFAAGGAPTGEQVQALAALVSVAAAD